MLGNAIAVANGKGGVGKTSLAANLCAIAAASGWRVLAVDLDMQANLGMDLGYRQRQLDDGGKELHTAIQEGRPVNPPLWDVRDGLDVVPAGTVTRDLEALVGHRRFTDAGTVRALAEAIEPIADRYDLIVFDCPPSGASVLADLGLAASNGLVIPVKFDEGSLDGLELMGTRVRELRTSGVNPDLRLLGIVLFDLATNETSIRAEVQQTLKRIFGGNACIVDPPIRRSARAARDMRRDGVVAIEYERQAAEDRNRRLSMLRKGTDLLRTLGPAKSQAAEGIADDYMAVSERILEAFSEDGGVLAADPWAR